MSSLSVENQVFIQKVSQVVEDNLKKEGFGVSELARELAMSRSMLYIKIKSITQKSVSFFIREIKLKKAMVLLKEETLTVSEIAYELGFGSPSYFIKCFHEYYGYSPGEYKKTVAEEDWDFSSNKGDQVISGNKDNLNKRIKRVMLLSMGIAILILSIAYFSKSSNVPAHHMSLAILPFDNLSSDENTQYFADGVVEDLLTRLSGMENLKVISRTSSEIFRNKKDKTIPEIGEILDVSYILEGTVQREDNDLRISIQLIDAKNDDHVFSKQYDRNLDEIFEVQREIAHKIASEIAPVMTSNRLDRINHDYTHNTNAFEYYQLGRFYSNKRTTENLKKGIEFYEQAIAEDPDYALAYAGLADNYHLMAIQGRMDKAEGNKLSLEMAQKALKIDPDLAEAHTVIASYYTFVERNWEAAEKEFKKALALNPNYSTLQQYYAEYLSIMGRDDEARSHIDKGVQLDPFSFIIRYRSSRIYYDQEIFDRALEDIKVCLEINSEHGWATNLVYDIYLALGNDSIVYNMLKQPELAHLYPPKAVDSAYAIGGIEALVNLQLEVAHSFFKDREHRKAIWYAMAGEYEKAMNSLVLAMEEGILSPLNTTNREYKPLRSDPRFIAIRKEMGLPPL